MSRVFTARYLALDSSYFVTANILVGMLLMIGLHCLATALRSKERNYLYLGTFFIGALINAVGNLYIRFFIITIEPYIGSWIMMASFILFMENYLALPRRGMRIVAGRVILGTCAALFLLSVIHNIVNGSQNNGIIVSMDIITAILLVALTGFLLFHAVKGNLRSLLLLVFELTIVVGGISALGIVKETVIELDLFPVEILQGNLIFIAGMSLNGLLFSTLLGFDLMTLKVKTAVAETKNRELKELDRVKTEFMMNISHELRTPLTVIGGVVEQLKAGKLGDSLKSNTRYLEIIQRNNLRLMKQVDNLLQLSRMEHRRRKIAPCSIDLTQTLRTLSSEFFSLAQQKGLLLVTDIPEGLTVQADSTLFQSAVVNLLSNAIKFTPPEGRILIGARREKDELLVYVEDTGPGIAEEDQHLIFRRFHRLNGEKATNSSGTGIGLSLVNEIMQVHHGSIELESRPGEGSRFTLRFPDQPDNNESSTSVDVVSENRQSLIDGYKAELYSGDLVAEEKNDGSRGGNGRDKQIQVLLVEDNTDLLTYLTGELRPYVGLTCVRNGLEALSKLKTDLPDLVISDVMMPEMDGYELYEAMQNDETLRQIPVLFLTARNSPEEKISAYRKGIVEYIEKPFSSEVLIARIKNIVETNKVYRKHYRDNLKNSLISFIENFQQSPDNQHWQDFTDLCVKTDLTGREREIALLIRQGLSDKEIADTVNLSVKTVGNYNTSIFRKLNVSGRLELMALGRPN